MLLDPPGQSRGTVELQRTFPRPVNDTSSDLAQARQRNCTLNEDPHQDHDTGAAL